MLNYDEIYRIAMFGHRDFNGHRQLEEKLIPILRDLIRKKKFIEIYMGRDGEFDAYAATLVKRVQKDYDDYHAIEFNLVLPYPKKDMEDFEKYYDRVDIPISAHPNKFAPVGDGASTSRWQCRAKSNPFQTAHIKINP